LKLSKSFFVRLFWFVIGGVLSIAVNAGLFRLFFTFFGWNRYVAYGLSLAIINVLLFLWNYVVGFRTDRHWSDSAWRQGVCLAVANGLNYALVMILQGLFPRWPEAIIAVVQVFIAFFKFGLYHYWVYPQKGEDLAPEPARTSS
jgi:putative flippase GtrA